MNLENVTVELRPRSEWEAVELGARMVRRDAASIYRAWFTLTLPAIVLIGLTIWFTNWGGLALLIYWWLEPITDGPILRIISRHLFGEKPDASAALRATWQTAWQNKLYWLTPYRLHFARSAMLPVTQLEGLTGARRRSRSKTIGSRIFSHGTGVTAAYQHLALSLYSGAILLVFMFMPESFRLEHGGDWLERFYSPATPVTEIVNLVFFYIAQSLLHPWFVGAGFGLYINCRTQLEAWDIEVAFRRMVQRRALATVLLVGVFAAWMALPGSAQAQEADTVEAEEVDPGFSGYWQKEAVDEALERVYTVDELDTWETYTTSQRIDRSEDDDEVSDGPNFDALGRALDALSTVLAVIFEFAIWLVVALLLLMIFMTRKQWLPYLTSVKDAAAFRPRVVLADGEVTQDDLPDDIPGEVRSLWRDGRKREALSLLYRASVFAAVMRYEIRLPDSATEQACLREVRRHADEAGHRFFRRVVTAWMLCAYASRIVDESALDALTTEWSQHFGETA
ncbi:MAG: hypothetical protein AAF917_01975 [Pseudomonadota bacterium]